MSKRLPTVRGGSLVEAVGGPFDGEVLYLSDGEPGIHVWRFPGDPQTLSVRPKGPKHGEHYVGWYSPGAAVAEMTQAVYWHPEPTAEEWDAMRTNEREGS